MLAQADSPEELRRYLAGLAGPLLLAEREVAEEEVRLNAVLSWLGANPGWLLILDNVDAPPALAEANRLMGRLAGGHVLLTGRLDRFARQVEPLEIDVLSREAAAAFLVEATDSRRRKAADDDAAAGELADELGRLALALEQAAATIENSLRPPEVSRNLAKQSRAGGRLGAAGDHRLPPRRRRKLADLCRSIDRGRKAPARAAGISRAGPGADVPVGRGGSRCRGRGPVRRISRSGSCFRW